MLYKPSKLENSVSEMFEYTCIKFQVRSTISVALSLLCNPVMKIMSPESISQSINFLQTRDINEADRKRLATKMYVYLEQL